MTSVMNPAFAIESSHSTSRAIRVVILYEEFARRVRVEFFAQFFPQSEFHGDRLSESVAGVDEDSPLLEEAVHHGGDSAWGINE